MKWIGAGMVFLAELGMYVCLIIVALRAVESPWRFALAAAFVVVVASVWGTFLSPRAPRPLPLAAALAARLVLVLGAAALATALGALPLAVIVASLMVVGTALAGRGDLYAAPRTPPAAS